METSITEEIHEINEVEDAMPGYHEHEDASKKIWDDVDVDVDDAPDHDTDADVGQLTNAEHKNDPPNPTASPSSIPSHICPICEKVLQGMDNVAINAHLDFCLSKGVIMEATSSTSASCSGTSSVKKPAFRSLKSWVGKR